MNSFFRFENAMARFCAVAAAFMILVAAQGVNAANLQLAGVTIVGNTLNANQSADPTAQKLNSRGAAAKRFDYSEWDGALTSIQGRRHESNSASH